MKKILTLILTGLLAVSCCIGLTACKKDTPCCIVENMVLAQEEYGIAAKKGNESLMGKINEALIALADTDYKAVAKDFGLESELLVTSTTVNPYANATDDSWEKVVESKELILGYTLFAPIAFKDDNAKLTGFDIKLAEKVVAYLNTTYSAEITLKPIVIEWASKEANLEDGTIDLVWNGMTINSDRLAGMTISVPYLKNQQVAVIREADKDLYKDADSMKNANVGAEKGSAGEGVISSNNIGKNYTSFTSQLDAYNQLKAGTVDVIVIDSVMANYYISLDK